MTINDDLRNLMFDTAEDLAIAEPDPASWAAWLTLLCKNLEAEALQGDLDPDHPQAFELMLEQLREAIADRLNNHKW